MKIIKVQNKELLAKKATELFVNVIKNNESPILGLATGSTPERMYELLIEKYKNGEICFANVLAYNLDEYVGLAPNHLASCRHYLQQKLYNHVNTEKTNTFLPNGLAIDLEQECNMYEQQITQTENIDFLVIGTEAKGHIGFNEPDTSFNSRTQ